MTPRPTSEFPTDFGRPAKARREAQATYFAGPARVLEMIASGVPLSETLDKLLRLTEAEFPEMLSSIHLLEDN